MHISQLALRVLIVLSINNGITNAVPAPAERRLDSAALVMLQTPRPINQTISSEDLMVPSIPDFRVEYRERRDQKLHHIEMYCNCIFAMIFLIKLGWDSPVLFRDFQMTTPWYRSELRAREEVRLESLRNKHLILAIHGLSLFFAPRNHFNYQEALGSIQGRLAIRVTLQLKGPRALDSSPNTVAPNTTTGAIVTQGPSNQNAVSDVPGRFIDPDDTKFVIRYERQPAGTRQIYVDSLFTTFTEALADLAPHDANELGARVNSAGHDRSTRLVVLDAGTADRPLLSYGRCVQALGQVWRGLIELHEGLRTTRFDIEYAGVKLGSGFIKAVEPPTAADA